jgi:hypothetical protein
MHVRAAAGLIWLTLVLVGCGGSTESAAATTEGPTPGSPETATEVASATPGESFPPAVGQTDTDWGRIWDTLPQGFPAYPGSTPAEETATGPASADLVVEGVDAKAVATLLQMRLTQEGYQTVGLQGPLENGGYVLDMTGSAAGCKLRVTAAPTGGLTTVTILYGAACPHD